MDARIQAGIRSLGRARVPNPADEAMRIRRWAERTGAGSCGFDRAIRRRARREPFSHIVGRRLFWTLELEVTPAVLDPRPESETLVEAVLSSLPADRRRGALRVLDLGTGSGCLLLSLLSEMPAAEGVGVDRSQAALLVARRNAARCGVDGRCRWLAGDWTSALSARFDVVASNPPYVTSAEIATLEPEVREFEPRLALDGGRDGLDAYRRLVPQLARCLEPDGLACLEFGAGQAQPVERILRACGFDDLRFVSDLERRPRCVLARRTAAR